jgi:hypothetical protein
MEDDKTGYDAPRYKPTIASAFSGSNKANVLADNLESQFQPLPVPLMQMDNVEQVREAI